MSEYELKEAITLKRKQLRNVQSQLVTLLRVCAEKGHKIVRRGESAICDVCRERLGWWCATSPDHVCHYSADVDYGETCIYCGNPEERK